MAFPYRRLYRGAITPGYGQALLGIVQTTRAWVQTRLSLNRKLLCVCVMQAEIDGLASAYQLSAAGHDVTALL
jgi:hypothetical protein